MPPAPEQRRAGAWDHAVLALPNVLSVLKHGSLPVGVGREANRGAVFTDCLPSWLSWCTVTSKYCSFLPGQEGIFIPSQERPSSCACCSVGAEAQLYKG